MLGGKTYGSCLLSYCVALSLSGLIFGKIV